MLIRAIQYPGQLNLAASAMGTKPSLLPASQLRHLATARGSSSRGDGSRATGISIADARHAANDPGQQRQVRILWQRDIEHDTILRATARDLEYAPIPRSAAYPTGHIG